MYICICNSIKDKHVDSVISQGCASACDVFQKLGCQPVCGKCVPEIHDTIQDHRTLHVGK